MDRKELLKTIISAVEQSQENCGRDFPKLDGSSCLIGDMPGCDSLVLEELALDLTITLSDSLGEREIPADVFKGSRREKQPTLNEIALRIEKCIAGGQGKTSASAVPTNGGTAHLNGRHTAVSLDSMPATQNGNGVHQPLLPQDDQLPQ